jgi:hypothetical protein
MTVDTAFPSGRRSVLRLAAVGAILSALPPLRRVLAQDEAGLLVSHPGALGPDFERLNGAKICAGGRAGAVGSTVADALRERGATIVITSTADRFAALERGLCDAALFVGHDYSQLERDVRDFFPVVEAYEVRRSP